MQILEKTRRQEGLEGRKGMNKLHLMEMLRVFRIVRVDGIDKAGVRVNPFDRMKAVLNSQAFKDRITK